tara:strand:- start:5556 stop:6731 length:1176 start_codon:yes stop_codon:yes gene_type:complete
VDRRQFHSKSLLFGAAALSHSGAFAQDEVLKAAVIGHTGRGDYGHRLDVLFRDLPNVQVVAVADADSANHEKAKTATGAPKAYADFQEMLAVEKPNLVSVAPRWTDQHFAMGKAALEAGAHVYLEKPFTQTLAQADELLKIANEKNLKIAVAHQMLLDPKITKLKDSIDKGEIGDLLEVRLFGKQDARAGAEDMVVLGTHLFDLARYFAGDAIWCTARISEKGSEITVDSGRSAIQEDLGKIAGDHIHAYFAMSNGVDLTFQSRPEGSHLNGPWGLELIGTKAKVRVFAGHPVKTFLVTAAKVQNYTYPYVELFATEEETDKERPEAFWMDIGNRRIVDDWLRAIQFQRRDPICSGYRAMKALEMITAVFQAGISRKRVFLPLSDRTAPFD